MSRARRAGPITLTFALVLEVVLSSLAAAGRQPVAPSSLINAASVTWPVATLVISEVQTGGASASDEFAELSNNAGVAVDLVGL
jgi:hypothetical protein